MNSKFSKKVEISVHIKNIVLNGKDVSEDLSDSDVTEIMDTAQEEALQRASEYHSGEVIFSISIDDIDYEVFGWFDKKTI